MIYQLTSLPVIHSDNKIIRGAIKLDTQIKKEISEMEACERTTDMVEQFNCVYEYETYIRFDQKTFKPIIYGSGEDKKSPHILIMDIPFRKGDYFSELSDVDNIHIVDNRISSHGMTIVMYVNKPYIDANITFNIHNTFTSTVRNVRVSKKHDCDIAKSSITLEYGKTEGKGYGKINNKKPHKLPKATCMFREDYSNGREKAEEYGSTIYTCDDWRDIIRTVKTLKKNGHDAVGMYMKGGVPSEFNINIHHILTLVSYLVIYNEDSMRTLKSNQIHRKERTAVL